MILNYFIKQEEKEKEKQALHNCIINRSKKRINQWLMRFFKYTKLYFYPFKLAAKYSRFIRAIFSSEIPFGHSISQAPVFVQFPKPSKSIW